MPPSPESYALRNRAGQRQLANDVSTLLSSTLAALPDLSDESLDRYVKRAYPVLVGGQRASANLAAAYSVALARLERPRAPTAPEVDLVAAMRSADVLVTPESRSLPAPVLRARALVGDGQTRAQALSAASSYAGALASNDLQAAQRVGMQEGAATMALKVVGYRKDLDGEACDWCLEVANEVYRDAEAVPFHDRDRCAVSPVLEGE